MSNQDNEPSGAADAEAETNASTSTTFSSLMSRRLQTFGSPDLEVTIGKSERLYHYHALSLASQSLYVDTLLSSPAATREQEKWRISFPEITVEIWEKMIKFLEPRKECPTLDDLEEIIPFYDQFQFHGGLGYCDVILSMYIPVQKKHYHTVDFYSKLPKLARLVSLIHHLNFFPLSKPLAVQWAARCLSNFAKVDEEMIRLFIPLIENDEKVIKSMVLTYLGRKSKGMSMTEMRDLIQQQDFPEKCILKCREIKDIDEQIGRLEPMALDISGCQADRDANGRYEYRISPEFLPEYDSEYAVSHKGGAMASYWEKRDDYQGVFIIESLDVYGSVWELYTPLPDEEGETMLDRDLSQNNENRRVLLRWESEIFTSFVPPKHGLRRTDGDKSYDRLIRLDRSYRN
mmetsp:Transcript_8341/g.18057  ORF Transcript_8341/g.18057 Transcript_8341/m.18057 type:complete len:403 (+) Transcript_8341:81-1289(+)